MNKKTFSALFIVVFAAQIGIGIISPLMPLYAESMGVSGLWLGIMFSGYAFSRMIFAPITGRLSDVRGRKRFIALGLLAYTITSLLYVWAPNIAALTVVRLLHGIGAAMVIPIALAYIGDLAPEGKEGTYINLFSMSMFLGMGFGPVLGGVLTEYFNMDAAFYAMTVVSSLGLCLHLLFVPPTEPRSRTGKDKKVASVTTIIRDSRLQAMSVLRFSRAFWRQGIIAFLPLFAISTLQMTIASSGLVLSAYLLTGGIVQGLVGPLVDRVNKVALIAISSTISPAFFFLIPYMQSGKALLAILLPIAVLSAIGRGTMLAVTVETGKRHGGIGTVMGIFGSVGSLGMMLGPIAFGYVMDVFGLTSIFTVGAIAGIIGGLVAVYLLVK